MQVAPPIEHQDDERRETEDDELAVDRRDVGFEDGVGVGLKGRRVDGAGVGTQHGQVGQDDRRGKQERGKDGGTALGTPAGAPGAVALGEHQRRQRQRREDVTEQHARDRQRKQQAWGELRRAVSALPACEGKGKEAEQQGIRPCLDRKRKTLARKQKRRGKEAEQHAQPSADEVEGGEQEEQKAGNLRQPRGQGAGAEEMKAEPRQPEHQGRVQVEAAALRPQLPQRGRLGDVPGKQLVVPERFLSRSGKGGRQVNQYEQQDGEEGVTLEERRGSIHPVGGEPADTLEESDQAVESFRAGPCSSHLMLFRRSI